MFTPRGRDLQGTGVFLTIALLFEPRAPLGRFVIAVYISFLNGASAGAIGEGLEIERVKSGPIGCTEHGPARFSKTARRGTTIGGDAPVKGRASRVCAA